MRNHRWLRKCHLYIAGREDLKIITDHKPLLSILKKKSLDEIQNPQILKLKEKLLEYCFTVEWKKGKNHYLPDALSRSPVDYPDKEDKETVDNVSYYVRQIREVQLNSNGTEDEFINGCKVIAKEEHEYQKLKTAVEKGFHEYKKPTCTIIQAYWNLKDDLSVDDELVISNNRIVIPSAMRKDVMKRLHASHQDIEKTKQRAKTLYWRG